MDVVTAGGKLRHHELNNLTPFLSNRTQLDRARSARHNACGCWYTGKGSASVGPARRTRWTRGVGETHISHGPPGWRQCWCVKTESLCLFIISFVHSSTKVIGEQATTSNACLCSQHKPPWSCTLAKLTQANQWPALVH